MCVFSVKWSLLQIDKIARAPLKSEGKDYAHGTGHGVGYFLNVHEGPQSISKHNSILLDILKDNNDSCVQNDRWWLKKK